MSHVTLDTRQREVNLLSKFQLPSSYNSAFYSFFSILKYVKIPKTVLKKKCPKKLSTRHTPKNLKALSILNIY